MLTNRAIENNGLSIMPEPSDSAWLRAGASGVEVRVRVIPNGRRTEIQGLSEQGIKIRLNAPPVDGKANAVLRDFLADRLEVPRSGVALVQGEKSRQKTVWIRGRTAGEIRERLGV